MILYVDKNNNVLDVESSSALSKFKQTIIKNGTQTEFAINHNLNTEDVIVQINNGEVPTFIDWKVIDKNNIRLSFNEPPDDGVSYNVTIFGSGNNSSNGGGTSSEDIQELRNDIDELRQSFQDGVDTIYNKCVSEGSTPTDNSPNAISNAIGNLRGGGNATSADILYGKTAYANKQLITGSIQTKTLNVQPTSQDQLFSDGYYSSIIVKAAEQKGDDSFPTSEHYPPYFKKYNGNGASSIEYGQNQSFGNRNRTMSLILPDSIESWSMIISDRKIPIIQSTKKFFYKYVDFFCNFYVSQNTFSGKIIFGITNTNTSNDLSNAISATINVNLTGNIGTSIPTVFRCPIGSVLQNCDSSGIYNFDNLRFSCVGSSLVNYNSHIALADAYPFIQIIGYGCHLDVMGIFAFG